MTLADDLKPFALEALAAGVGAAIREFTEREPDAATKAKGALDLAKRAIEMLPEGDLHGFLTDEDAAVLLKAARLLKAAKLAGK